MPRVAVLGSLTGCSALCHGATAAALAALHVAATPITPAVHSVVVELFSRVPVTFDGHQVTNGAMAPLAACHLQSLRSDWCVLGEEGGVCVGGGALRDEIQQHLPTRTDTDRSQPPLPHRFAAASRAGFLG